jgi:hypothetical protein
MMSAIRRAFFGWFRKFDDSEEPASAPSRASTVRVFPLAARQEVDTTMALTGVCPVCSAETRFENFTDNPRESGTCTNCGSFNRQRQMAHFIRRQFGLGSDVPFRFPPGVVIYNTETTGALHKQLLSSASDYVSSEYFGPQFVSGQEVGGRRHEDLQRLSFADDSIDLILSSDVMEHVPEPYTAHREIFRTLKPGGRHIFTVPFDADRAQDNIRAKLVDGEIVYLAEQLFHGDPVRPEEGVLVWTIFGLAMLVRLEELGFEVSAWNLHEPDLGIIGPHALIFEAMKPTSTMESATNPVNH